MGQKLRLIAAAGTDPGKVHPVDQDSAYAFVREPELGRARGLFIVADGMGGHQAGEIASRLAVETLYEELDFLLQQSDMEETAPSQPADTQGPPSRQQQELLATRLRIAVEQANSAITQYARNNPQEAGNMGTTLTCVLVDGDTAIIANIGDSRTYLLRDGNLGQITEDHSYVAQLVREGQIAPEEVFVHPRRNVITRSLGYHQEVAVDLWSESLRPADRLLLCSDGLWEMIQDEAVIADHLRAAETPEESVSALISAANSRGGADNIGVVVVHILT